MQSSKAAPVGSLEASTEKAGTGARTAWPFFEGHVCWMPFCMPCLDMGVSVFLGIRFWLVLKGNQKQTTQNGRAYFDANRFVCQRPFSCALRDVYLTAKHLKNQYPKRSWLHIDPQNIYCIFGLVANAETVKGQEGTWPPTAKYGLAG